MKRNSEDSAVAVVFRLWFETNDVIALFPECPADCYHCTSFQHIGQHGAANYWAILSNSRPATPTEYEALKRELESEPYNYPLRVVQRQSPAMRKRFRKSL